jgi:hypothetical protein
MDNELAGYAAPVQVDFTPFGLNIRSRAAGDPGSCSC